MAINGIKMITDRSQSDIIIAKTLFKKGFANMTDNEKTAFLEGLKGAYNYTDINRVEGAIQYLLAKLISTATEIEEHSETLGVSYDKLLSAGYDADKYENGLETKTDWTIQDKMLQEDRERYINNILFILDDFEDVSKFPRSMEKLTYLQANNIELALDKLNVYLDELKQTKITLITNTANAWFFSGDLYGGEI